MADANVGTTDAVKTVTEPAAAEKAVSHDGSAKPSAEVQKRIDELTGEKNRKDEKIAALEAKLSEVVEANKTAQEKQLDALIEQRTGPQLKRLARAVSALTGKTQGQPFTAGANAPGEVKRQITAEQFFAWQNLPAMRKFDEYEAQKAEMNAAFREGRIIGLGG